MLNRWLAAARTAVQKEGGSVDKFIGDAIMAEFGAPLHCVRIMRAGRCAPRSRCATPPSRWRPG